MMFNVKKENANRVFELADLILAIGRQIRSPQERLTAMCTPLESTVMRFVDRHPGASAREASKSVLLPSSNFARTLRALEQKGLVRREVDTGDARSVRLYPTALAKKSVKRLRDVWVGLLDGIVDDPATMDMVIATMQHVENELAVRRQNEMRGKKWCHE